jgi:acyl-lipid omega-6 desaturase (Delta-12 desaturase)
VFLFLFVPLALFPCFASNTLPKRRADGAKRSRHLTKIAIAVLVERLVWIFGWRTYLIIQMTAVFVTSGGGVWLFYIQHEFEGVTWERMEDWDFTHAVLQGSSYYRLSRILQQFSGNIEFHHIHHLSPHIPNYETGGLSQGQPALS